MIRDGIAVLLCLNIAVVVFNVIPTVSFNPVSQFIDSLTSVLLCRLILNLRSYDLVEGSDTAATLAYDRPARSLHLAHAVIDNIGASISFNDDHDDDLENIGLRNSGLGSANVTLDEFMRNPLAIGLQEDAVIELPRLDGDEPGGFWIE